MTNSETERPTAPEGQNAETIGRDGSPSRKKGKKKLGIACAVVAAVVAVAGASFWVWHEQPSFCNAICHTPMDGYVATYEQEPGVAGTDKWGNEVENTSAMLAVSHKAEADADCLACHVPTLGEQIAEGMAWVTGGYSFPLSERTAEDLVEARELGRDEFCMNGSCHAVTRDDLAALTSDMDPNPHVSQHNELACTECHKAHRASVLYCTDCHGETDLPDGWVSASVGEEIAGDLAG